MFPPLSRALAAALGTVMAAGMVVVVSGAPAYADPTPTPAHTWGTNGRVWTMLPAGDRVFVGGSFTAVTDTAGASHPARGLAVLTASTGSFDLRWQGTTNGDVTALALSPDGRTLYVGGSFAKVSGQPRAKLAAVDAATGALRTGWTATPVGPVDALAATAGSVFAGGAFISVGDRFGTHNSPYVAKLDAGTGDVDTGWAATPNGRVRTLAASPDGSHVYLGGDFGDVSGQKYTNKVASLFTADSRGQVDPAFRPGPNTYYGYAEVFVLATDGIRLYEAVGGSNGACTAVSATTGVKAWMDIANGNVQSVAVAGNTAYCGGHFGAQYGGSAFAGTTRNKVAAVDAATGSVKSLAPTVNSSLGVWSVAADPTHLFLGGDFTKVSGTMQAHFAEFLDPSVQGAPLPPALAGRPGDSVAHLSWTPPSTDRGSAVQRYVVYRRTAGGSYPASPLTTVRAVTAYDDSTVVNGETYAYAVTAVNALGESAPSNETSVRAQPVVPGPPSAPTSFTAISGAGSVQLSWSVPDSDGGSTVSGYRVYRGGAPGAGTLLADNITSAAFTDAGATAGTTYYYTVTAVNGSGEGLATAEATAKPSVGPPSAPVLTGTSRSGAVHLSWTPSASDGGSPVLRYVVYRDRVRRATIYNLTALSWDDTTGGRGVTHTYFVRAVNRVGTSPNSNVITVAAG